MKGQSSGTDTIRFETNRNISKMAPNTISVKSRVNSYFPVRWPPSLHPTNQHYICYEPSKQLLPSKVATKLVYIRQTNTTCVKSQVNSYYAVRWPPSLPQTNQHHVCGESGEQLFPSKVATKLTSDKPTPRV